MTGRRTLALLSNYWHVPRTVGYNRYALSVVPAIQAALGNDWECVCVGFAPDGVHERYRPAFSGHFEAIDRENIGPGLREIEKRYLPTLWHVLTDTPELPGVRAPVVATCHGIPFAAYFRRFIADGTLAGEIWDYLDLPDRVERSRLASSRSWQEAARWRIDRYRINRAMALETRRFVRALGSASAVICVSEFVRSCLDAFLPAKQLRNVVGLAPAPEFVPPSRDLVAATRLRYSLPDRYILAVHSFSKMKNVRGLFALTGAIRAARTRLVLAAPAGSRAQMTWLLEEFGLRELEDVWLLEDVPQEELVALYGGAEVFLNLTWIDTFALPVVEAMACGTPVVASAISAVPETVGDGGLIVDPRKPVEVARTVMSVLNDQKLRCELKAKGLARAREFSWEKTARRTVAVYERVIAQC